VSPDSSNGLIVSAPVCHRNLTISIQPVVGPSRKQDRHEEEPSVASPSPKKPHRNKVRQFFLFFSSFIPFLIVLSSF